MRVSQMAASCETDLAHVRPISVPQPAAICDEICRHDFIHVSTFFRFLCQKSGKKTKQNTKKEGKFHIVLSLKITKSTVFWKFFSRDTAVSCSMCKKLCPLACKARTKHMMNNLQWTWKGRGGGGAKQASEEQYRPSSED